MNSLSEKLGLSVAKKINKISHFEEICLHEGGGGLLHINAIKIQKSRPPLPTEEKLTDDRRQTDDTGRMPANTIIEAHPWAFDSSELKSLLV